MKTKNGRLKGKKSKKNAARYNGYSTRYGVTFASPKYCVAGTDYNNENQLIVKKILFQKGKVIGSMFRDSASSEGLKVIADIFFGFFLLAVYCSLQRFLITYDVQIKFYVFMNISVLVSLIYEIVDFRKKETEDTFRHHAAEHMVHNAFLHLGYVPEHDVVKKYSRYSKYCGIRVLTNFVLFCQLSFILCIFTHVTIPYLLLYALAAFVIIDNPYSYLAQMFFTTQEANDNDIEIARLALKRIEELERGINTNLKYEEMESTLKAMKILEYKEQSLDDDFDSNEYDIRWNDPKFLIEETDRLKEQDLVESVVFDDILSLSLQLGNE